MTGRGPWPRRLLLLAVLVVVGIAIVLIWGEDLAAVVRPFLRSIARVL